jgi:hypothetical protein
VSYDLNFWKYQQIEAVHDHASVYERLCDEEDVEDLEVLPISAMVERIAELFEDWHRLDPLNFECEGQGSFQVSTTPRSVRIDCYGMTGDNMNLFVDMGNEFGCPLYDPQTGVRFDGSA